MSTFTPITYRDFYDIPRIFVVAHPDQSFLFDCRFSDATDEYEDSYAVYLMPSLGALELEGSWENLSNKSIRRLGRVSTSHVEFDESRRRLVNLDCLALINEEA